MKNLNLPKEHMFTGPALVWKRGAAFVIDILILAFFGLFPFRSLLESMAPKEASFSETLMSLNSGNSAAFFWTYSVISILAFMYFFLMEKNMSQTIGKKVMNIYVTSDSGRLSAWQALLRNMIFIPLFPFDFLMVADPFFMFFMKSGRRLSEILSKTNVVETYSLQ